MTADSAQPDEPAARIDFTPDQLAMMREACGLGRPGDREVEAGDLLVIFETRRAVEAAWQRITDESGPWHD